MVRPLATMTGDASFNEVFFSDVRVPAGNIVAGRGDVAVQAHVHAEGQFAHGVSLP